MAAVKMSIINPSGARMQSGDKLSSAHKNVTDRKESPEQLADKFSVDVTPRQF